MTGRAEHDKREAAADEAAGWLLRVDAPDATEADWLALQAWLEADPGNRDAYDRAERVSAELGAAAPALLAALEPKAPAPAPRRRIPARSAGFARRAWRALPAVAAAAAAAVVFVTVRPAPPAPTEVFQTAKGESRMLDLADGSHIQLNSASRLTVRLERKARYIELAEGEAAFDVAHDTARPFLIAAGERTIRVVGTEFDVLRHDGRLKVTVRRGVVAVERPADAAVKPVLLRAGDQLEHDAGDPASVLRKVDPEAAFAWRSGSLVYRDQSLDEVVGDLNRYFATPVAAAGAAGKLRFSGVLKIDSEEAVVDRLEALLPVVADRGQAGVTLRMRQAAR